jgi:hypothetical protein
MTRCQSARHHLAAHTARPRRCAVTALCPRARGAGCGLAIFGARSHAREAAGRDSVLMLIGGMAAAILFLAV